MEENNKNESINSEEKNATSLLKDIKEFFKQLTNIEEETNKTGTIAEISANISMKGHTAWILVFSIIIASIGLNVSSTAVVIGAMLISPLMGPILGVGMSIAINDVDTLRKSVMNLGVMIGLSLITSSLFFSIPLFNEATPEILARTSPDVRDVLIAFAGGLALIVAISRPSPQTNTVAGVAIATALMPPLCTAGFGVGTGNWDYFIGAMFLFTINTIFIALSTFVIIKFLNFPVVKYIDSKKKKNISRIALMVSSIILAFSIYSFYSLFKENQFNKQSKAFIENLKEEGISIIADNDRNLNYKEKTITFFVLGNMISEVQINKWTDELHKFPNLKNAKLIVKQKDDSEIQEKVRNLTDLYSKNQSIINSRDLAIQEKDVLITQLRSELEVFRKGEIPFAQICDEVKINYSGIKTFKYGTQLNSDFKQIDTLKVFSVQWYDSIPKKEVAKENLKLESWLKTRLVLDSLVLNVR